MSRNLFHQAVVCGVSHDKLSLLLDSETDCSGCAIASFCGQSKATPIEIVTSRASDYAVGQKVIVSVSVSSRYRALTICILLPLFAMMLTVVAASLCGASDLMIALLSLGAIMVCFLLIWLLRHRLDNSVRWRLVASDIE